MPQTTLTLSQRVLRPVLNFIIERLYPEHCFYGNRFANAFAELDTEHGQIGLTAVRYLISIATDRGCDNFHAEFDGVSFFDKEIGDWDVIVFRADTPQSITRRQLDAVMRVEWTEDDRGCFSLDWPFGPYVVFEHEGYGWCVTRDGHDDSWVKYPDDEYGFESAEAAKEFVVEYLRQQARKMVRIFNA